MQQISITLINVIEAYEQLHMHVTIEHSCTCSLICTFSHVSHDLFVFCHLQHCIKAIYDDTAEGISGFNYQRNGDLVCLQKQKVSFNLKYFAWQYKIPLYV